MEWPIRFRRLGATRYINESKRLLSVYEQQLDDKDYLVGAGKGKYSFADLTSFTWARFAPYSLGIPDLGEAGFPNVAEWVKRIEARPVVAKMTADDMLAGMKKKPNWEDDSRKRAAWVWEEDEHKKDEL
jgi:glutathione S-transferase